MAASLTSLSILGIRSFGTTKEDAQQIDFISPVTIIHGCNGSGKTTIIECLKYITTGDQPPNTKNGAFIHDPKILYTTEVKANVKLQFRDVSRKMCLTTRSLEVKQKGKKNEMKTLDTAIKRMGADGNYHSLNSRCNDMTSEMISLLGVSKPILQNVIFCHQEDANWPLSEGKVLKTKFDDIFASTRYVKGLEELVKFRKEKVTDNTNLKAEMRLLKDRKEKADEILERYHKRRDEWENATDKKKQLEGQVSPLQEEVDKLNKELQEIEKVQKLKDQKATVKKEKEKRAADLCVDIPAEFEGTDEDLFEAIDSFDTLLGEKKKELLKVERSEEELRRQLEKRSREVNRLLQEKAALDQMAEDQAKKCDVRDKKMSNFSDTHSVEDFSHQSESTKMDSFQATVDAKTRSMEQRASKAKESLEEEILCVEEELNTVRDTQSKLKESIKMKSEQKLAYSKEIRQLSSSLAEAEASGERREALDGQIADLEAEMVQLESSLNVSEVRSEVDFLKKGQNRLRLFCKELSSDLNKAHEQAQERNLLLGFEKQRDERNDMANRLKSRISDTVREHLGEFPASGVKKAVEGHLRKMAIEMNGLTNKLEKATRQKTAKLMDQRSNTDELKRLEEEKRVMEERLSGVMASGDFDQEFARVQTQIAQKEERRGILLGLEMLYKKYKATLVDPEVEEDDKKCPLCKRQFSQPEAEVDELVQDIQAQVDKVPEKMARVKSELEKLQTKKDDMIRLQPEKEKLEEVERALPVLRATKARLSDEARVITEEIDSVQAELVRRRDDEEAVKGVTGDAGMLDSYMMEVKGYEAKVIRQTNKTDRLEKVKLLDELKREEAKAHEDLEKLTASLDKKESALTTHLGQVDRCRSSLHDCQKIKLQIEKGLQERVKHEERKERLVKEVEALNADVQDNQQELKPLQPRLVELSKNKNAVRLSCDTSWRKAMAEISALKQAVSEIMTISREIERYERSGADRKRSVAADGLERETSAVNKLKQEEIILRKKVEVAKREIQNREGHERELKDNQRLREVRGEITKCEKELARLNRELARLTPMDEVNNELYKCVDQMDSVRAEIATAVERARGLYAIMQEDKRELNTDKICSANENYRRTAITQAAVELTIKDLDLYYTVMDRAIMAFHKTKMEELNKIIRHLWYTTYMAADITSIEIRSEDEEGTVRDIGVRKVYKYRVVMLRGNTELDMRGRCSAGQKVLASIVIRLALAETFCINCGMLTLDEPTTNLDDDNIQSLAMGLGRIIEERSKQKNFQLVVITHDQKFLDSLSAQCSIEHYYKVSKNSDGCSRITKTSFTG